MVLTCTCLLVNYGGCDFVLASLQQARRERQSLEQLTPAGACVKVLSDASDVPDLIERHWLAGPRPQEHIAASRLSDRLFEDNLMLPAACRFLRESWKCSNLSFGRLRPTLLRLRDPVDDSPEL
jgi:hypothetical protein